MTVRQILLRHLYAVAQLERLKIRRRDAADYRERDDLLIVAAGHGRGTGGVAQRSILAPEIEFVARAQFGIERVEYLRTRSRDPGALPAGSDRAIERRKEGGAGDARLCIGFLNTRDCARQIVIAALGLGNQLVELRRPKPMPPSGGRPNRGRCVAGAGTAARRFVPSRRQCDIRPLVRRPHAAAAEQRARTAEKREPRRLPFHARHPGLGAIKREWSEG